MPGFEREKWPASYEKRGEPRGSFLASADQSAYFIDCGTFLHELVVG